MALRSIDLLAYAAPVSDPIVAATYAALSTTHRTPTMKSTQHARSCGMWSGCERDHGTCPGCGVYLNDRIAMSFGKSIWFCEACYANIRDSVDQAVDALGSSNA